MDVFGALAAAILRLIDGALWLVDGLVWLGRMVRFYWLMVTGRLSLKALREDGRRDSDTDGPNKGGTGRPSDSLTDLETCSCRPLFASRSRAPC